MIRWISIILISHAVNFTNFVSFRIRGTIIFSTWLSRPISNHFLLYSLKYTGGRSAHKFAFDGISKFLILLTIIFRVSSFSLRHVRKWKYTRREEIFFKEFFNIEIIHKTYRQCNSLKKMVPRLTKERPRAANGIKFGWQIKGNESDELTCIQWHLISTPCIVLGEGGSWVLH